MDHAEFDQFADEYDSLHRKNIAVTGEAPEYFHEYKIKALRRRAEEANFEPKRILDFGSGIGNSIGYLRRYFPNSEILGSDLSERSLDIAEKRFPDIPRGLKIEDNRIPADDNSFDMAFSACVFHHIPHEEHAHWLSELHRVTRKVGMLAIFEHNPLNPLTVRAVNTCPFDTNAHLIRARQLTNSFRQTGWSDPKTHYHLFFPHSLSAMRWIEPHLSSVPFGGQYSVTAIQA